MQKVAFFLGEASYLPGARACAASLRFATSPMTVTAIDREPRLTGIADTLSTSVMQPFWQTLGTILDELDRRRSRPGERHFRRSELDKLLWPTSTGASTLNCIP